jgi:hypothetical protein
VAEFREKLNAASDDARIEVHQDGDKMTLHVVEPVQAMDGGGGGGTNDSHLCPPVCP